MKRKNRCAAKLQDGHAPASDFDGAQELLGMDAQNREVLRQERLEWRREEEEHAGWCDRQSALYGLDSEPAREETKPSDYVDDHADVQQSWRGTQLSLDFEVGDQLPF